MFSTVVMAARGTIDETITKSTSVLVYEPVKGAVTKAGYANKHNRPIVSPEWLAQSIACGRMLPIKDFLLPEDLMKSITHVERQGRHESDKEGKANTGLSNG